MTSKIISVLAIVLIFTSALGQEKIWTKQSKMSEIIAFEKSINPEPKFLSQSVSLSKDYYPLADKYHVTNPIIIERTPFKYLPVYAEYFYTPGDSVLRLASYDWERDKFGNFFDKQKIWNEESKKLKTYNKEYERIKNLIIEQLGTPNSTDSKLKEVESDRGKYFTRESVWDNADFHAELDMVFESMTYRIRFTIYWKQ